MTDAFLGYIGFLDEIGCLKKRYQEQVPQYNSLSALRVLERARLLEGVG